MSEPVSPSGEVPALVRVDHYDAPGSLVDTRMERGAIVLCVRFDAKFAPRLALGTETQLEVESDFLSRTLRCCVRPSQRAQDAQFITYDFITERDDSRLLGTLANRRGCIRVRPDDAAPLQLVMRAHPRAPRRPLPVLDISGTGMAVVAPRIVETELVDIYRVYLELRLPEDPKKVELEARILHRRLRGNYVQYGLEFDPSVEGFAAQQDRIFRYVTKREAEEIVRHSLAAQERRAS